MVFFLLIIFASFNKKIHEKKNDIKKERGRLQPVCNRERLGDAKRKNNYSNLEKSE